MLKVTLVNPPTFSGYPQPPMGLIQLAAVIEEGFDVNIIDANALNLRPEQINPLLEDTGVLGLTATTPTVSRAIEIAAAVKDVRPELPVILGGPHATLLPRETMESTPDIDVIVAGEAEISFYMLLSSIEKGGHIDQVPGVFWEQDGEIVENERVENVDDLDSLPFLAYNLIPLKKYRPHPPHGRAKPFAVLITSRGCPYNCAYCSKPVFGKEFRAQSPERVVDEIEDLQARYGVREIAFYDDVFTLDKHRAAAISEEIIRRGIKIIWSCETRVNLVDQPLLGVMKKAGCYSISYGLESGNQDILNTINKNTTLAQAEEAVRYTREAGINAIGYFMIGSPGETLNSIKETMNFAKKLKLGFAQFSITTPFPGTELYNLYLENGGRSDIPWEDYVYAGSGEGKAPVFESDVLKRKDIVEWQKKAYRDFYLRPSYIWQRILSSKSPGEIKVNFNGLSMLLRSISSAKQGR